MFKQIVFAAALIGTSFGVPAAAQDAPTEQEQAAIVLALQRGEALYRYDQAAWHGTDAMLKDIKNPQKAGVAGWVVNEAGDALEVVFYGQGNPGYYALWSGVYDGKKVKTRTKYAAGERLLTPVEIAQVEARKTPSGEGMERCSSQPFNTVVLPTGKDDGSMFVYFLVPQEQMSVVPFGGHYRYEVKDGKVVDSRNFANSCISLGRQSPGKDIVAVGISHSLDAQPTEIHVFSMYVLNLPVAVMTTQTDKVWMIEKTEDGPIMTATAL